MKTYYGFQDKKISLKPRAIAIGVFDGVHRGHSQIIRRVLTFAKKNNLSSMVVTFDPHPNKVLKPKERHSILMSLAHRLRLFERMGVQETLVVPFNARVAKMSHDDFVNKILVQKLRMKALCVGHDFRFGNRGVGDTDYLKKASIQNNFKYWVVSALKQGSEIISSTRIRELIEKGELSKAKQMLGRDVSVYGDVIHGRGRGKSLGFPTANLNPHHEALPPQGVYAARGYLDKQVLKGMIHIGQRPTFNDKIKTLEVHFLNFHKNIYKREVELVFIKKLRDIRKFKSKEALVKAIKNDVSQALKVL